MAIRNYKVVLYSYTNFKKGEVINLAEQKEETLQAKAAKWFKEKLVDDLLAANLRSNQYFGSDFNPDSVLKFFKRYFRGTNPKESFERRILGALVTFKNNLENEDDRYQIFPKDKHNYNRFYYLTSALEGIIIKLSKELANEPPRTGVGKVVGEIIPDSDGIVEDKE